jgi:hypothetical protein
MMKLVWLMVLLFATACPLVGQETTPAIPGDVVTGHRWMLICCGLPGDDMHREKLTTAVSRIVGATEPVFQVPSNRLRVLVGDETMAEALKDLSVRPDICTAEETAASLQALAKQIQPNDSLWIICLGHAQLYAGRSTFNVKGKDFDADALSKWLTPVQCRERIVMLTMPVSGFWIKPLRGPNTVLISATAADYEFTGTEMPYALANVVSGNSEQALKDIDQDGQLSLLDLYLATCLEVHTIFKDSEKLQTEHALLDDNGDGVAREVQQPYLPVEAPEGDVPPKPAASKRIPSANGEGDFARTLKLLEPTIASETVNSE